MSYYDISDTGMLNSGTFSWERKAKHTDYRRKVYEKYVSEYDCPENVDRSNW